MSAQPEALQSADYLELAFDHTPGLLKATAELRRLHELCKEWERKAATWMASPDASKQLDGYRELAQQLNTCEEQRDELLDVLQKIERGEYCEGEERDMARAAIAKIKGTP
jgi:hypothetical protein